MHKACRKDHHRDLAKAEDTNNPTESSTSSSPPLCWLFVTVNWWKVNGKDFVSEMGEKWWESLDNSYLWLVYPYWQADLEWFVHSPIKISRNHQDFQCASIPSKLHRYWYPRVWCSCVISDAIALESGLLCPEQTEKSWQNKLSKKFKFFMQEVVFSALIEGNIFMI